MPWRPRPSTALPLIALLFVGCAPDFNLTGRDQCFSDADCANGRLCDLTEALNGAPGTCTDGLGMVDPEPDPSRCAPSDVDLDGAFTLEGCGPIDCDDNNDRRSPLLPELCDNLDNDCDNLVDEGALNACGQCGPEPQEFCNGRDDDCDGAIDDGVSNACGTCGTPPEEYCDGLDNDCDGAIDEGFDCTCEEGASRTCPDALADPSLICAPGVQFCTNGLWGVCDGAVLAREEVCDGLDNDCDGPIDEGFDLQTDLSHCGACGQRCGSFHATASCVAGQCQLTCQPGHRNADGRADNGCEYACIADNAFEVCDDGLDNNCDGAIDEGCPRVALSGTYTWLNVFGRSSPGLTPGLVAATIEVTDPTALTVNFTDRVLYALDIEEGERRFNTEVERRVDLTGDGFVEIVAQSDDDGLGGLFRGRMTPDRRAAAFIEYNSDDQQVASFAVLIRAPKSTLPLDPRQIRGLYTGAQILPAETIQPLTGFGTATALTISLDPGTPEGLGREEARLGGAGGPALDNPFTFVVGTDGLLDVRLAPSVAWRGTMDTRGGFGALLVGAVDSGRRRIVPGLTLFIERRDPVPAQLPDGQWTLVGLQTFQPEGAEQITYNAIREPIRMSTADGVQSVLALVEGVERTIGTTAPSTAPGGPAVEMTLALGDNLQPPTLTLRGRAAASNDLIVFWEVDGEGAPLPSLFVAVRHPENGTTITP